MLKNSKMKDQFDREDELLGLVRKQGLLNPSAGFTSRVMQSIELDRSPVAYQPLLSRKAWAFIISGFFLTIILCWYFFSGNSSDPIFSISESFDRIRAYINKFDLSFRFNTSAVLIITLALLSMGLLIILDLWLSTSRRHDTV